MVCSIRCASKDKELTTICCLDNGDAPPAESIPELEAKRSGASYQDVIDGKLITPVNTTTHPRSKVEPRGRVHSGIALASPAVPQPAFSPRPAFVPAQKAASSPLNLNAAAQPFVPSISAPSLSAFADPKLQQPLPQPLPKSSHAEQPAAFAFAAATADGKAQSSKPSSAAGPTSSFSFSSQKTSLPASPVPPPIDAAPLISAASVPTLAVMTKPAASSPALNQTIGFEQQSSSSRASKRMSTRQIDAISKRLANKALVLHTEEYVREATQHAVDAELKRRSELESRLAVMRRTRIETKLVEGLLNQIVESLVRDEAADAYGEEMWESPLRLKVFTWWRKAAREKRALRMRSMQRSVTRDEFSKKVKGLTISTLASVNANAYAPETLSSRTWPAEDMDVDTNTQLRKVSDLVDSKSLSLTPLHPVGQTQGNPGRRHVLFSSGLLRLQCQ